MFFSDLDGTLLDHHDYSFAAAQPALDALRAAGVPLILASSKTAAEMRDIRDAMELARWPAIVENGAGLLAPGDETQAGHPKYDALRKTLDQLPSKLREQFAGFGDMSEAAVADCTGLSPAQATRAKKRAFTEPGVFSGDAREREEFREALAALGVFARDGGRFLTLSFGGTKADGLRRVARELASDSAVRPFTVALGDAPNDEDMLRAADQAVVVRNDASPDLPDIPGAIRTELSGPAGWNQAVLSLIHSQ